MRTQSLNHLVKSPSSDLRSVYHPKSAFALGGTSPFETVDTVVRLLYNGENTLIQSTPRHLGDCDVTRIWSLLKHVV